MLEQNIRIVVQLWTSAEHWGLLKLHQTGKVFYKAPGKNLHYHKTKTPRASRYLRFWLELFLALPQHATFSFWKRIYQNYFLL